MNATPPSSGARPGTTTGTTADTGATRLDLAALTAHRDVAAPTQAIPTVVSTPPAPPTPAAPAATQPALPAFPVPRVTYRREHGLTYDSAPAARPTERERQRIRADEVNDARNRAELERIQLDAAQRAAAAQATRRRLRHQRRMDVLEEIRAWGWILFAYACFAVLVSTGVIVALILLGKATPPWMHH